MKTLICGGRSYKLTTQDYLALDSIHRSITSLIVGGAIGVDHDTINWGLSRKILVCVTSFSQENAVAKLLGQAQICIAFEGGKNTEKIVKTAISNGLIVLDWRGKSRDASALDLL